MNDKRPNLNDVEEFNLIRRVYFKDNKPPYEELDPLERLERMEAKHRFNNRSPR